MEVRSILNMTGQRRQDGLLHKWRWTAGHHLEQDEIRTVPHMHRRVSYKRIRDPNVKGETVRTLEGKPREVPPHLRVGKAFGLPAGGERSEHGHPAGDADRGRGQGSAAGG